MANGIEAAEDESVLGPVPALEAGSESVAPEGLSWPALAAVYAYAAALALATVALLLRGPLHGAAPVRVLIPEPAMCAVVCVVWAVALWAPVSMHHRGNTYLVALEDVPLLLGLVFLSPALLVLACVVAAAFVFFAIRKQALNKVCFNVAAGGLGVAVCQRSSSARSWRPTARSAPGAGQPPWPPSTVNAIVMYLMVLIMAKLYGHAPERRTGPQLLMHATITAASMCLAIVVFDAAWMNLWATVPVLLVAALIITAYRGYTRLSLRFASLQRLYDFSRALGTANLEPSSMSLEVLSQVCTVMRARRAQLVLAEPSGIPRRISLDDHGPSEVELISLDESSIVTQAIESGVASLHSSTTPQRQEHLRPDRREIPTCPCGPAHQREDGDRSHRRAGPRRGARRIRRRRPPPLRGPRRARQRQPRACPPRRGAALRGRQQVPPGDPRHADRTPQPHAVPQPRHECPQRERWRRHRPAGPRPLQGRQRHARPCHR